MHILYYQILINIIKKKSNPPKKTPPKKPKKNHLLKMQCIFCGHLVIQHRQVNIKPGESVFQHVTSTRQQEYNYAKYFAVNPTIWILHIIERERNVLFNDALNTFDLRLYGVRHMVKAHSDSEKRNPLPPHRLLFPINSKGSFICTIPQTG